MKIKKRFFFIFLCISFLGYSFQSPAKRLKKEVGCFVPIEQVRQVLEEFRFHIKKEKDSCQEEKVLSLFSSNGYQPVVTVLLYNDADLKEVYKKEGFYNYTASDLVRLSILKSWIHDSSMKEPFMVPDNRSHLFPKIIQELVSKNNYKGPFDTLVLNEYQRIYKLPGKQLEAMILCFCKKNKVYPEDILRFISRYLLSMQVSIAHIAYPEQWMI